MKKTIKKLLASLLVAVMVLTAAPLSGIANIDWASLFATKASAAELTLTGQCGDNVYWTFDKDTGLLTISGTGTMINYSLGNSPFHDNRSIKSVVINNGVTSIGEFVFLHCTGLTSVTIPDSVTSIGRYAFADCTGLTSVNIPNSVTSIGDYAFGNCTSLTSITVDKNNKVYDSRNNCNAIIETATNTLLYGCKNTVIPDSVTSIGNDAFYNCTGLKSITIPDSVTSIRSWAFGHCTGLTNITIPNSVTSIGSWAFGYCTGLTSITIPNNVTSIGSGAFYYTGYYNNKSNWNNNVLYIGNYLIEADETISGSYTVKSGTRLIANDAFWKCEGLTSITIPNSVTSIGEDTFYGCTGLTNITIPRSVTSIGGSAFNGCTGLTNITIPSSVTSIGGSAFYYCTSLTNITIPNSVTSIGNYAFYDCKNLKHVYYTGTEEQWNKIKISSNNEYLTRATIHFNQPGNGDEPEVGENDIVASDGTIISLSKEKYFCNVGEEIPLSGEIFSPQGTAGITLEWSVTDDSGISINTPASMQNTDANHIIFSALATGKKEGEYTVTVKTSNGASSSRIINVYNDSENEFLNKLECKVVCSKEYYYSNGGFYSASSSFTDSVEFCVNLRNYADDDFISEDNITDFHNLTLSASINSNDFSFDRDEFKNNYSISVDTLDFEDNLYDMLLLYPQKSFKATGKDYILSITVDADEIEPETMEFSFNVDTINKVVDSHLDFCNSCDYNTSKKMGYGSSMLKLKNDAEYVWSKYTSFDFKNYYDIVFADLLAGMLNVYQAHFGSEILDMLNTWVGNYKTILAGVTTIVDDSYGDLLKISDTKIDKLLKCSKYTEQGIHYADDELYTTVMDLFGNVGNAEKITKVFATFDKANQWIGFIKLGVNVFKDTVDYCNTVAVYDAFANCGDESLKTVIRALYNSIPDSENKMKDTINDYLNYNDDNNGRARVVFESFGGFAWNVSLDVFKSFVGKKLVDSLATHIVNWVGTIELSGGAALSSTAAFGGIQTACGAFCTGVSLGLCFSEILCNSSGKAAEMSKTIYMSQFEPYVISVLNSFENQFKANKTMADLDLFHGAFALHKATESYILDHTVKALEAKKDSLLIGIIGQRTEYNELIKEILANKTWIDAMDCCKNSSLDPAIWTRTRVIEIKCPVDVYVYDENGQIVLKVINEVVEFSAEGINYFVDNGEKYVALPDNKDYKVKIVSRDNGTMAYAVSEYVVGEEQEYKVSNENIILTKGKIFEGIIPEDSTQFNLISEGKNIELREDWKVNSVSISDITINYKKSAKFNPKIEADSGVKYTTEYKSSNPKVATVDKNGNVYGAKKGNAAITCTVTDEFGNTVSDTCTVNVKYAWWQWIIKIVLFGWIWY